MTIKEGYFSDEGTEIDQTTVPTPTLCISCLKNNDATEEVSCMINRIDQMKETKSGERFLCFAYEPNDPSINKKKGASGYGQVLDGTEPKILGTKKGKKNHNKKTITLVSKKKEETTTRLHPSDTADPDIYQTLL